jgi:hypothetical protein
MQVTGVTPKGNREPDGGRYVITGESSQLSKAAAEK